MLICGFNEAHLLAQVSGTSIPSTICCLLLLYTFPGFHNYITRTTINVTWLGDPEGQVDSFWYYDTYFFWL